MTRGAEWESESLKWLHEVRESHYRTTRQAWLKPVAAERAARACRRMGLKVRLGERTMRRRKAQKLAPRMSEGTGAASVKILARREQLDWDRGEDVEVLDGGA